MLRITVTQEHIDDGWAGNCGRCPVALAALDAGLTHVHVSSMSIYAFAGAERCGVILDDDVRQKIIDLDTYGQMDPFTFEIDLDLPTPGV